MQVEIWSDVVCPWCYLGKRYFEQALQAYAEADSDQCETFSDDAPLHIGWPRAQRHFDADLAIVADRAGMERQECVFIHVLRQRLACDRMSLLKTRLALENCFDQLVDQFIREVGSPDPKIIHSDGDIVLIQRAVSPGRDLQAAELRHRFPNGLNLFGKKIEECDRLLCVYVLHRRCGCPDHCHDSIDATVKKVGGHIVERPIIYFG
jgi:hypothetical protein